MEGDGSDAPVSGAGAARRRRRGPGSLPSALLGGSRPGGGAEAAVRWLRFLLAFPVPGRFRLRCAPSRLPGGSDSGAPWARERAPSGAAVARRAPGDRGGALRWGSGCGINGLRGVRCPSGSGRAPRRPLSGSAEVGARVPGPRLGPARPAGPGRRAPSGRWGWGVGAAGGFVCRGRTGNS